MKPYQGMLAWISYLLLQVVLYSFTGPYYTVIAGIIALIVLPFLLHKKQMLHLSSRDLKGSQLFFCCGIGLGLGLIFKISIVASVLSGAPISEASISNDFLWMATTMVLLPVVEELLFRGILFGSFSRSFSYRKAIVLSTVPFLIGHHMISWPLVLGIGILLAWIYWRTDNLAVAMVIHCVTNFFSLLSEPLYALLAANRTLGIMAGLLMVLLGIGITYLCTKKFLQKHDALPA